jgi:hypothetical protein
MLWLSPRVLAIFNLNAYDLWFTRSLARLEGCGVIKREQMSFGSRPLRRERFFCVKTVTAIDLHCFCFHGLWILWILIVSWLSRIHVGNSRLQTEISWR